MTGRFSSRGTRLALAAAAIIGVAATVATAASLSTKTKTAALPGDATTHVISVKCPKGKKSTGGGIRLSDDLNDYAQGTYPKGRRGWSAAAYNSSPPDTEFSAFARCLEGARVTTESKTEVVPADGLAHSAVARCPRGRAVVGGGVRIADDDVLEVGGSHPKGKRGWKAVARPTGTAGTVTATARCVAGLDPVRKSKEFAMPDDNATHEVTVKCPKGTKSTGGGLRLSDPVNDFFQGSYPRGKRGWTAAGFDSGTVTAHVICLD